jgi:hypothetical protein
LFFRSLKILKNLVDLIATCFCKVLTSGRRFSGLTKSKKLQHVTYERAIQPGGADEKMTGRRHGDGVPSQDTKRKQQVGGGVGGARQQGDGGRVAVEGGGGRHLGRDGAGGSRARDGVVRWRQGGHVTWDAIRVSKPSQRRRWSSHPSHPPPPPTTPHHPALLLRCLLPSPATP